jgi:hypothetical protein
LALLWVAAAKAVRASVLIAKFLMDLFMMISCRVVGGCRRR